MPSFCLRPRPRPALLHVLLAGLTLCTALGSARAAEPDKAPTGFKSTETKKTPGGENTPKEIGNQVRDAVRSTDGINVKDPNAKRITLVVNGKERPIPTQTAAQTSAPTAASPAKASPAALAGQPSRAAPPPVHLKPSGAPQNPADSRLYVQSRGASSSHAEALGVGIPHDLHWSYSGATGPETWWRLKPEFNLCGTGRRQSPIAIDDPATLRGPAEAIDFRYQPSGGIVVNNGHTIQVDVSGDNMITVRSSTFKLVQFHFHHPAEERINGRGYAMVAHLVHRNAEGQLAVVAVLLEPGAVNKFIDRVWTYMPLDKGDTVRIPPGQIDLNDLLPKDQRYYQYLGSLTTPPCTEGVLWMIIKQPATLSPAQLQLFGQLFPNNTRPVQPANDRPIRNAQ